nr:MAG TPA: hypothetical protein [Caudoviricetes sp.]
MQNDDCIIVHIVLYLYYRKRDKELSRETINILLSRVYCAERENIMSKKANTTTVATTKNEAVAVETVAKKEATEKKAKRISTYDMMQEVVAKVNAQSFIVDNFDKFVEDTSDDSETKHSKDAQNYKNFASFDYSNRKTRCIEFYAHKNRIDILANMQRSVDFESAKSKTKLFDNVELKKHRNSKRLYVCADVTSAVKLINAYLLYAESLTKALDNATVAKEA